jgi:hypothetical protein
MLAKIRGVWGRWRESRRQYKIERALYKMRGGPTGTFATDERLFAHELPHVEAPEGKGPDPSVK